MIRILATLVALVLACSQASAFDASRYPSPTYNGLLVDHLTIQAWQLTSSSTGALQTLELGTTSSRIPTDWLVGGASNFAGLDRTVSVNGTSSAGFAMMVGGVGAAYLQSSAGLTAVIESRAGAQMALGAGGVHMRLKPGGAVNITPQPSLPVTPSEGDCVWDGVAHKLKCYDGSAWQSAW